MASNMVNTVADDRDEKKMAVAAIDFGTTFSGYAFAFRNDKVHGELRIHGNQWAYGSQAGVSLKTSTCALFNPDKELDSFGADAEDRYADLTLDNSHHDWYYFRRFKMMLYKNQCISRERTLEDDKGNVMSATKVYRDVIAYLKRHMLDSWKKKAIGLSEDEIHWVITVPAIWSDAAKQFMREAAQLAEIPPQRLEMALEPEAASIYCKHIPVGRRREEEDDEACCSGGMESIQPGVKYLVLDAGGGTVDITVQQVQNDGSLHQVYKANGGDWGGTKIDEAFEEYLISMVGVEVMDRFKKEHRDCYIDIFREFEIKKRTITPDTSGKVTFKIPIALNDVYQDVCGQSLRDSCSSKGSRSGKVAWIGDKMRLDASEAKDLFQTTCGAIAEHIDMIFEQPEAQDTSIILMVGGFSESKMLQAAIKRRYEPSRKVIIPPDAGLSVLKGAVLFGFDTRVISQRVMKDTYGIQVVQEFHEGDDPEELSFMSSKGTKYCDDVFSQHVCIGQAINLWEATEEREYFPLEDENKSIQLKLYTSDRDGRPKYCNRDKCSYIGKLDVDLPKEGTKKERGVGVKLRFGGTEVKVEARVLKTGSETSATLNLLG